MPPSSSIHSSLYYVYSYYEYEYSTSTVSFIGDRHIYVLYIYRTAPGHLLSHRFLLAIFYRTFLYCTQSMYRKQYCNLYGTHFLDFLTPWHFYGEKLSKWIYAHFIVFHYKMFYVIFVDIIR